VVLPEKEAARAKKQEVVSTGTPLLGGEWDLIDHNSKPVTSAGLEGQWLLLYFGFTHCPDICPEELEKMAAVIEKLGTAETGYCRNWVLQRLGTVGSG
jgi:protein SCO1/2